MTWALAASGAFAQATKPEPDTFLRRFGGFGDRELAAVESGRVVARVLETRDPAEIAVLGVVRVDVPPAFLAERFRDIERFKRGENVLAIGVFGDPPRSQDLAALALDDKDVEALSECRVGDCKVKLTSEAIERFRQELRGAPDPAALANVLFRSTLAERVSAYRAGGDAALTPYQDKRDPRNPATEFRRILGRSPYVPAYVPELDRYLRDYPRAVLPGSEEFFYWSKEAFGLKPVVSITHAILYPRPREGRSDLVIASRQIYASHYFEASLGLTMLVENADEPDPPTRTLIYLNRSRIDALGGALRGVKKYVVERRLREGMERNLAATKERLEAAWRAACGS